MAAAEEPAFIVEPARAAPLPISMPPVPPQPAWRAVPQPAPRVSTEQTPQPVQTSRPLDIESLLGADWMAKLGIAAIAVSAAFFLQYAFRNGWIKPWGQVGIGLVGAVLMMGAGQLLLLKEVKERFRSYAQVLFSGGIAVYFLSIYAAYHFYSPPLLGYWPAFGALAAGAIAASALALANGTEAVAVICILGAFAAPALIREQGGAPSGDGLIRLYVYLAAIDLWAALFIRFRAWHSVAVVSLLCTWVLFFGAGPIARGGWRTESFAALFLLWALWAGVSALSRRADADENESAGLRTAGAGIILAGCLAFIFASAAILAGQAALGVPDLALAGVMLGVLLAGLAMGLPAPEGDDGQIRSGFAALSALAGGGVLLVALAGAPAVPADQVRTAFVFVVLSYALFFAMGLSLRRRGAGEEAAALMLGVNAAAHVLAALHVLAHTQVAGVPAACLWLPLLAFLSMGGVWLATKDRDAPMLVPAVLAVAAQAFVLAALLRAVGSLDAPFTPHWPAPAAWLLTAEFVLFSSAWVGLRERITWPAFRMDAAGAVGGAAMFFCLLVWALGNGQTRGISLLAVCAAGMAAWHGVIGGVVFTKEADDDLRRYTYLGLAATFLTIAVPLQLKTAWVTIAWAAEAAAIVWAGTAAKSRTARMFGCVVLAIAACRALVVDLARDPMPFHFLFNGRTLAGIAVIAAAYLSAWLIWTRRGEAEDGGESETAAPGALVVVANAFTLAFVSRDLWQQFGGQADGVISARQLALSLFWAFYGLAAICVGIWSRQRTLRLFAMGLLYLSILKVFLYDLGNLETPYRIASFFVLGIVFLLVSYLYTRFEERIGRRDLEEDDGGRPMPSAPAPSGPGAAA